MEQEDLFLVNYKIKELIGSNEYISNIDDFFKKWDISSSIKEKILKIKDNEILGNMVYYEKTLYILCQFFIEKEYSDDVLIYWKVL